MGGISATGMARLRTRRLLKMTILLHYIGLVETVKIRKADIGYIRVRTYKKKKNVNCRIFVAVNELMRDNVTFQSFYRMSKEKEKVAPAIEKQDNSVVVYVKD